jgi:hypothetical protein
MKIEADGKSKAVVIRVAGRMDAASAPSGFLSIFPACSSEEDALANA